MTKLIEIEGIGKKFSADLQKAGVASTNQLLKAAATAKGRQELAQKTGLRPEQLLEWVNHVDLMRIKGVGVEFSDLLELAGVDSVPELAQRKPENLMQKLAEVNQSRKVVRRLPRLSQIENWIAQAKVLPKVITH